MPRSLFSGYRIRRVAHFSNSALQQPRPLHLSSSTSTIFSSARASSTHYGRRHCHSSQPPQDASRRHTPSLPAATQSGGTFGSVTQLARRLQRNFSGDEDGAETPSTSSFSVWPQMASRPSSSLSPSQPTPQRQYRPPQRRPTAASVVTPLRTDREDGMAAASGLVTEALTWSVGEDVAHVQDDDVVLDTPASLLPCLADATHELLQAHQQRQWRLGQDSAAVAGTDVVTPEGSDGAHPAARGVGQDVIDLVTDVFTAQREAEVKRRREVLYELTHPNPIDYTYNGKLVPPPPLSFGQVTEEARSLGNKMMLGQTYSMVRQAGTRVSEDDFCGTMYTDTNTPRKGRQNTNSATTTVSPSSTIETAISAPSSTFSPQQQQQRRAQASSAPYRSRAREDNIFRDHNYFFEVNELYQEIVLVGRACAGKSSLLNSLLGQNVAKTSSSPNTTRKISFYQSVTPEQLHAFHEKEHHNQLVKLPGGGLQLTFVDMPGYGIEGMSDQWRDAAIELTDAYFGVRRSVNTVLYCMDCERGLTKTDVKYFEWLENVQGTFFVVLTKCDSVPHSRVTSVMRQVYTLITKHRHKYRKVFPYIIPTSAKDGTNMELLRGLITETSGLIPGDKLRDLLKQKKEAFTQTALVEEADRIDAARLLERAQAREFFQLTRGAAALEAVSSTAAPSDKGAASLGARGGGEDQPPVDSVEGAAAAEGCTHRPPSTPRRDREPRRYVVGLSSNDADVAESLFLSGEEQSKTTPSAFPTAAAAEAAAVQARRERRERFLAWRRTHPLAAIHPLYDAPEVHDGVAESAAAGALGQANEGKALGFTTAAFDRQGSGVQPGRPLPRTTPPRAPLSDEKKGGGRYHLHTGLDNPQSAQMVLDIPADDEFVMDDGQTADAAHRQNTAGGNDAASSEVSVPSPSPTPHAARSSIIGFTPGVPGPASSVRAGGGASAGAPPHLRPSTSSTPTKDGKGSGAVSEFLDVLESFGQQSTARRSAKQRRKEARWQQRRRGGLLAQDASGRVASYQAGKPCGPALVSADAAPENRQARWRAERLKELIAKENPEAPWQAVHQLRRKLQAREEDAALSGMRKKEVAAYVRDAGRVTESFEKFEGEVTAAKYMNEVRQAPTLRSQQQMHLNATAKINYRSMPPGLWKRYGEKETYWPTPQVLGRAEDESHKP